MDGKQNIQPMLPDFDMGLATWKKAPDGRVQKSDTVVAKNHLSDKEVTAQNRLSNAFLNLAEDRADRQLIMTMTDWKKGLERFLGTYRYDILGNTGTVSKTIIAMKKTILLALTIVLANLTAPAQGQRRPRFQREAFQTDTPMVHDPVMAKEGDTYYIYATGMGIQQMTSKDRRTWTVLPQPVMTVIPGWTTDSVPGFGSHVWAPDVICWHDRWWMAYSCSTFGKNGSAIGLLSSRSLRANLWKDEGCIVCSHDWKRDADGRRTGDNWNAIDPNFVIDEATDTPWLVWGSFWDGIQLARLDTTMHIAKGEKPRTIARRYDFNYKPKEENPTSRFAGTNAIEAPFIFHHGEWYYLFVSWDYCCRGAKSNYRVAVGRSRSVGGPYLDRTGKDMANGGGTLFLEGDKQEWEAAGHSAAYTFDGEDVFICHGYSAKQNGTALLIQHPIAWTADGWPTLQ